MTAPPDLTISAARAALLDTRALALVTAAGRAICDGTRAQIVCALSVGPLAVTDLTRVIGRPRTVTSQHLRILREAGLVETQRNGRWQYYRLSRRRAMSVAQAALDAASRPGRPV